MTEGQQRFIDEYRKSLIKRYSWAKDEKRLEAFIESCKEALAGRRSMWGYQGSAVDDAYRAAGGTGRISMKAIQNL